MSVLRQRLNFFLIIVSAVILGTLTSCEAAFDPFVNYREPFRVNVSGTVDGTEIEAVVFCDPTEHLTKEIYNVLIVSFSLPKSLNGITVSLRSDGKATVRLKDTEEELPLYSDIAEPFLALCPKGEPESVERTESGGLKIVYADGEDKVNYIFDENGQMKKAEGEIKGRKVSLNIINFP